MSELSFQRSPFLEWGVASRALPGEETSGDVHVIVQRSRGALAAVVDGLGHGQEATTAARLAAEVLKERAEDSIIQLVQHCHRALKTTRGAAMTVVSFDAIDQTVMALGVGNVETVLIRADRTASPPRENVLLRGGVVGYQLPTLRASVFPLYLGDLLIFATDGIRDGFAENANFVDSLPHLAQRLLDQHFRGTDDALLLAIRCTGTFHA